MAFDINLGFSPDDTWYGDYLKLKSRVDNGELVEVVRCKDCIHYSNPEIGWCDIHSHMTSTLLDDWTTFDDNSFCSDGERRDEE